MDSRKTLGDRSVLMVFVFSTITLGIYYAFWFMNRRDFLNNLPIKTKMESNVDQLLLALLVIRVIGLFVPVKYSNQDAMMFAMIALNLVCAIIGWVLAFRVKRILEEYAQEKISGPMTFFFTIYYF